MSVRFGNRVGYWIDIRKTRFGWSASWTSYGEGNRIGVGPEMRTWRPTYAWAKRVVTRRVERMKRKDARATKEWAAS